MKRYATAFMRLQARHGDGEESVHLDHKSESDNI